MAEMQIGLFIDIAMKPYNISLDDPYFWFFIYIFMIFILN